MEPVLSLHEDISVMDCGLTDFNWHFTEFRSYNFYYFFLGSASHQKLWCKVSVWVVVWGARGGGNIIQTSIQLSMLC